MGPNDYVMDSFNPCQFPWKSVQGGLFPIQLKYNPLMTLCTFPFLFLSRSAKTGGRIFTIYTSNDADSPKDVPFEGFGDKKTVQPIKTPQNPQN